MKCREILRNESEYIEALAECIQSFRAYPGTPEYCEREVLLNLIKDYEDRNGLIKSPGKYGI